MKFRTSPPAVRSRPAALHASCIRLRSRSRAAGNRGGCESASLGVRSLRWQSRSPVQFIGGATTGRSVALWASASGFIGIYEGIARNSGNRLEMDQAAAFSPVIKPAYQPKTTGRRDRRLGDHLITRQYESVAEDELKGWNGTVEDIRQQGSFSRADLNAAAFPRTLSFAVSPATTLPFGLINIVLDHVQAGDAIEIDAIRLKPSTMADSMESFVFAYAHAPVVLRSRHGNGAGQVERLVCR